MVSAQILKYLKRSIIRIMICEHYFDEEIADESFDKKLQEIQESKKLNGETKGDL